MYHWWFPFTFNISQTALTPRTYAHTGFRKDHDAKKLDSKRKSGARKRKADGDVNANGELEDGTTMGEDDDVTDR